MRNWLKYWNGRIRLLYGFCPNCDSSPPQKDCLICHGTYDYGHGMNVRRRLEWRYQWDYLYQANKPPFRKK